MFLLDTHTRHQRVTRRTRGQAQAPHTHLMCVGASSVSRHDMMMINCSLATGFVVHAGNSFLIRSPRAASAPRVRRGRRQPTVMRERGDNARNQGHRVHTLSQCQCVHQAQLAVVHVR